ncbi:helicase [Pseudoclavibacter sp. RFBJ3]|uniref:GIY-YIG nuclease family protein n=1 Tax=unclassified Pseudoclavibacter TaxID=2615177 RepID=UPI000CE8EF2E|nr:MULTISPECIES: GIY-YIG nuclease family protein [unclassified Pseudoclavibacter]PPF80907.1 helicase [Pseudoclavibacter sp. RFBJ5]PPF94416.1 helicase [Pseudoclavibacter sp. RFBJ3]PPF99523.1 helicase [Pseudoclavibacter sp. RFBH5]PPG25718.1 helicase [Pseudoclavibacter sp. RFBI4]
MEHDRTEPAVPLSLDDILDDELLIAPEKPKKLTSSDRLERAFLEIVEFRRAEGRLPSSQTREIAERKLGARLDGFLANDAKAQAVQHLDEFGLLEAPQAPASLDELIESEDLDELLGDEAGILDVSDLPVIKRPESAESIAQRVRAKEFDVFEPLFKAKHAELADGTFTMRAFTGMDLIREGTFFVLNGVMCFVAEIGEEVDLVIGGKPKRKQRLRLVFENGTESAMYNKSLQTRMYESQGQVLARAGYDVDDILDMDIDSGHIYVLQSLSTDPVIANLDNLHKIGFSTTSVERRLQGASLSPTYLMAPVKIVADYRVYNVKASALENLLHRVFAEVRLDLTQVDRKGRDYDPSEWFVVPRDVINRAVAMIMSGEIADYVYDPATRGFVRRG